jgi:hypothetical protein
VVFDPAKVLVAKKDISKQSSDWYNQFYKAPGYLNRFEALQGLFDKGETQLSEQQRKDIVHTLLHDSFWKMRQLCYSDILQGISSTEYVAAADSAARHDKNSKVRAAALNFVLYAKGADDISLYKEKLADSSYEVDALALQALGTYLKDTVELLKLVSRFEFIDWPSLAEVVSSIYSHHPSYAQAAFFHRMPYYVHSSQMGRMLDSYKRWLVSLNEEDIINELNYTLKLSNFITDEWTAASYKAMLNHLATHLETKGGHGKTEARENAINSLREKANTIRIRTKY